MWATLCFCVLLPKVTSGDSFIFTWNALSSSCVCIPVACSAGCIKSLIPPCHAGLSALNSTEQVTNTVPIEVVLAIVQNFMLHFYACNTNCAKLRSCSTACPLLPRHCVLAYTLVFYYNSLVTECIQLTVRPDRTFVSMSQAEGCLLSVVPDCSHSASVAGNRENNSICILFGGFFYNNALYFILSDHNNVYQPATIAAKEI